MRRNRIAVVLGCLLCAAWCSAQGQAGMKSLVEMTVPADGGWQKAYLLPFDASPRAIDSAEVKDGQCRLTLPATPQPQGYGIMVRAGGKQLTAGVFNDCQRQMLTWRADQAGYECSGSVLGSRLVAYRQAETQFGRSAAVLQQQAANPGATEAGRRQAQAQLDSLAEGMKTLIMAALRQNMENPLGLFLMQENAEWIEPAPVMELLEKVPQSYRSHPAYTEVHDQVQALLRTQMGQPYTDLQMKTPEGRALRISDLVGRQELLLVDFWASWCGPCMGEVPNLVQLYKDCHGKGLEIIGVSLDNRADAWRNALEKHHMTWPQMSDLKGWDSQACQAYSITGIPATVLIGKDGKIVARDLRGAELRRKIEELLGMK